MMFICEDYLAEYHKIIFSDIPKSSQKIPQALCRGNQGDAIFQVIL